MSDVVTLNRTYKSDATIGTLVLPNGLTLKTLERPWLDNRSNVSCIPEGTYAVKWMPRSPSGKYKRVWHLQDVDNRTWILMHNGNYVRNTKGCILIGMKNAVYKGNNVVWSSAVGLNKLRREMGGKDFILNITSDGDYAR